MADAPVQTPLPEDFASSTISLADIKTINELTNYLVENSYDYASHVRLIQILQQGFVKYVEKSSSTEHDGPGNYCLLKELRMTREAMESRYAVGEAIWRDWIKDEIILATSCDGCTTVMELCSRAVQQEPMSVVLWSLYAEWIWSIYAVANGLLADNDSVWTEEDKLICKEVFTADLLLSVWHEALEATKWRLDESHVLFLRYMQLIKEFPNSPFGRSVDDCQRLWLERLQIPHSGWSKTWEGFWSFVSEHKANDWEELTATANELAALGKKEYALRGEFEQSLVRASEEGDAAMYEAFTTYLNWESKRRKKSSIDQELRCSLFERALLCLPTTLDWWLDYSDYLTVVNIQSRAILPFLERATRHCPWSGELWCRRLLRTEMETHLYEDMENLKHKATNSALVPVGGMEEIITMYRAWCSYLRRRAFSKGAPEDAIDMAEMAISSVLSDIKHAGQKNYGEAFQGDPHYRIEQIFIKFLWQAGRIPEAREVWRSLVPSKGHNYNFWIRWYGWELVKTPARDAKECLWPQHDAADVLKAAMAFKNLDWPENIYDLYEFHRQCKDDLGGVQLSLVELRAARKELEKWRAQEAAKVAQSSPVNPEVEVEANGKRKLDRESEMNGEAMVKRIKTIDDTTSMIDPSSETSAAVVQAKRDREHNSVTIRNISHATTEKRLRQFFADCGKILSLEFIGESTKSSNAAVLEFESHEDVLAAKTRDGKSLDDHVISVVSGTMSTLYVTNYPATYAEEDIRHLFRDCGTIVAVRFPSLKFNQRRRFCYVQFLSSQEAKTATQLHNKVIDAKSRLVVLISDPTIKKTREGATAEGREVFISNIEHDTNEAQICALCDCFGRIEHVRLLRSANGKFTGSAFVIFATAVSLVSTNRMSRILLIITHQDEAQAALALDQKAHQDRLLRVSIATDKSSRDASNKKHGLTKIFEPANGVESEITDDAVSSTSMEKEEMDDQSSTAHTRRDRTVAVLNLPETVNDARVCAVLSQFGAIRKFQMRRDKAGAIVEFVDIGDTGRAVLALSGPSNTLTKDQIGLDTLGKDCKIGTVGDLLKHRKTSTTTTESGKITRSDSQHDSSDKASSVNIVKPVSRPGQKPSTSKRGGLGIRRGGFSGSHGSHHINASLEDVNMPDASVQKSNSEFRDIFLNSSISNAEQ